MNKKGSYGDLTNEGNRIEKTQGYLTESSDKYIISHLTLRRYIGILGIIFPVILLLSSSFTEHGTLPSMSAYYYSKMNTIFVGIIFSILIFLVSYVGEDLEETIYCRVAALMAFLIAIFPTNPMTKYTIDENFEFTIDKFKGFVTPHIKFEGDSNWIHSGTALVFFLILVILVGKKFVESEKKSIEPNNKRICLYRVCALLMSLSIICIPLLPKLLPKIITNYNHDSSSITFFCELFLFWLFGFAWLIKGEIEKVVHQNRLNT